MLITILLDQARATGLSPLARLVLAALAAGVLIFAIAIAIATHRYGR